MDTPCIVCQENCPVTPKAIFTEEIYQVVRDGARRVNRIDGATIHLDGPPMVSGQYSTGDYFCNLTKKGKKFSRIRIVENTDISITLDKGTFEETLPEVGGNVLIEVHLLAPKVDIKRCIGCGVCEHECPVSGKRAIRVSAENETRNRARSLQI
jgi:Pyruvate/2-oxoacid:ferredoxin oxidoreductase delta subunit